MRFPVLFLSLIAFVLAACQQSNEELVTMDELEAEINDGDFEADEIDDAADQPETLRRVEFNRDWVPIKIEMVSDFAPKMVLVDRNMSCQELADLPVVAGPFEVHRPEQVVTQLLESVNCPRAYPFTINGQYELWIIPELDTLMVPRDSKQVTIQASESINLRGSGNGPDFWLIGQDTFIIDLNARTKQVQLTFLYAYGVSQLHVPLLSDKLYQRVSPGGEVWPGMTDTASKDVGMFRIEEVHSGKYEILVPEGKIIILKSRPSPGEFQYSARHNFGPALHPQIQIKDVFQENAVINFLAGWHYELTVENADALQIQ